MQHTAANRPEAVLVAAAGRGDHQAWSHLHRRYSRMVHAILVGYVSTQDADDLVQEVFVTAMARIGQLHDAGAFGGWLARIARNRAKDFLRSRRVHDELPETLSRPAARSAEVAQVLAAIRSLPEAYREPLLMRLVEGMTGPEIAEKTGMTAGSVRVNLHRGMKMLRGRLGVER